MSDALRLEGLSGGYGALCVFSDVRLTLKTNEIIGIAGQNGAGKTTLLKTIAGLLPAQAGAIYHDDVAITTWAAYRRARHGLSMVMEGRQIFASLSVADNLWIARNGAPKHIKKGEFRSELARMFELFPRLKERHGQPGGSLSGGEQQMLAIARALLIHPRIVMLDEPSQGLAPIVIHDLLEAMKQMRGQYSVIIVEQNVRVFDNLADRVLTMQSGRLA